MDSFPVWVWWLIPKMFTNAAFLLLQVTIKNYFSLSQINQNSYLFSHRLDTLRLHLHRTLHGPSNGCRQFRSLRQITIDGLRAKHSNAQQDLHVGAWNLRRQCALPARDASCESPRARRHSVQGDQLSWWGSFAFRRSTSFVSFAWAILRQLLQ